jgi:cadmium resistance protein CadD (predicted permease)
MNTKAALNTAKVFGLCTLATLLVTAVFRLIPLEYISGALMLTALVMAIKAGYESEKEKLEALDRINTISKE